MLKSSCLLATVLLVVAAVTPRPARAAIIETDQSSAVSGSTFAGNISNSDLIKTGSTALAVGGVTYSGTDSVGNTTFGGLTDGAESTATVANDAYFGRTNSGYNGVTNSGAVPRTATYVFDTVAHPLGFDITQINTFEGFSGVPDYSDQRYDVFVSFVGTPAVFHLFAPVTFYPFTPFTPTPTGGPASSEVSLTDSTGVLVSGVAAIEFSYPFTYDNTDPTGVGFEDGQLVQEIDVFGSPTPEPTSLGIFALLGGYGLFRRRRHA